MDHVAVGLIRYLRFWMFV